MEFNRQKLIHALHAIRREDAIDKLPPIQRWSDEATSERALPPSEILHSAFLWAKSDDGFRYWNEIYEQLIKRQQANKLRSRP